jgi:hypothetical protein
MHDPCVTLESAAGRDALLARAQASLPRGECLVRITDVIGIKRAVRTVPDDPRAALVAREAPLVLRGGITTLVAYWRVPADALGAKETHYERGHPTHAYDVRLSVATVGTAPIRAPVVA